MSTDLSEISVVSSNADLSTSSSDEDILPVVKIVARRKTSNGPSVRRRISSDSDMSFEVPSAIKSTPKSAVSYSSKTTECISDTNETFSVQKKSRDSLGIYRKQVECKKSKNSERETQNETITTSGNQANSVKPVATGDFSLDHPGLTVPQMIPFPETISRSQVKVAVKEDAQKGQYLTLLIDRRKKYEELQNSHENFRMFLPVTSPDVSVVRLDQAEWKYLAPGVRACIILRTDTIKIGRILIDKQTLKPTEKTMYKMTLMGIDGGFVVKTDQMTFIDDGRVTLKTYRANAGDEVQILPGTSYSIENWSSDSSVMIHLIVHQQNS